MDKVEKLKELKHILDDGLITRDKYGKLRAEVMVMQPPQTPFGSTGRPFSIPLEPARCA